MSYPEIKKVCCFGAGLIGCGFASHFSIFGLTTVVYDADSVGLEKAHDRIEKNFANLISAGVMTEEQSNQAMQRILFESAIEKALAGVHYIQESTPDSYEVKKAVLETIDSYCDQHVIVATSSSALLVSKLAAFTRYPERLICAHPYNPVHLIPLVEIVGLDGSQRLTEHVKNFFLSINKEPVVLKKEIKGYIANRLQVVIGREIVEMLERGVCSVEDADKALTFGPGMRWAIMGHLLNMELGFVGGVKAMYDRLIVKDSDRSSYLDDMANWIKYPEDLAEKAQAGVDEEIANRNRETGNDIESLIAYRDKMLIEILKLHNKI